MAKSRKAGEATNNFFQPLLDMDDVYSKAIRDTAPKEPAPGDNGLGDFFHGARTSAAHIMGVKRDGGFFDPGDERYNETVDNIAKGTAIASRYVLPAAGVTAAGLGIYDLTVGFGGAADQPEQQQLTLQ